MRREKAAVTVLLTGLALILLGAAEGQNGQVLAKAVRICLECVGIG